MDYYSMSYEVMEEIANQIQGRYIGWADAATDPKTEQYWMEKSLQIARDIRQVDPNDEEAIKAKRAELGELIRSLPVEAPTDAP